MSDFGGWYPMDSYSPGDGDAGEEYDLPDPWQGKYGQRKCPYCGRFLTKGGTCSLYLPAYRSGSYAGMEHR
jgi:hypothetical protein